MGRYELLAKHLKDNGLLVRGFDLGKLHVHVQSNHSVLAKLYRFALFPTSCTVHVLYSILACSMHVC